MRAKLLQSCLTLCNPMDCSLPGSSLSLEFPRQESWSGLPFPPPGELPDPGIQATSPELAGGFFLPPSHLGSPWVCMFPMSGHIYETADFMRMRLFRTPGSCSSYLDDVVLSNVLPPSSPGLVSPLPRLLMERPFVPFSSTSSLFLPALPDPTVSLLFWGLGNLCSAVRRAGFLRTKPSNLGSLCLFSPARNYGPILATCSR